MKHKKNVLAFALKCMVISTLIMGSYTLAMAQKKPFAGQTIRVLAVRGGDTEAMKGLAPDLEKKTGIKAVIDTFGYEVLRPKIMMEVLTKSPKYDVFGVDEPWTALFAPHMVPFDEWPGHERVDIADFTKPSVTGATWQNVVYGIPYNGNITFTLYRKDLFDDPRYKAEFFSKYGYELDAPQTLEQWYDIASFFHRPEEDLYGWASSPTKGEFVVVDVTTFLGFWDIDILDERMRPTVDSPEAVEALKFYLKMVATGPPGAETFGHAQRNDAINSGRVAMAIQWPVMIPFNNDPNESVVAGKLGYALNPKGPVRRSDLTGTWAFNIPKPSRHKGAATEFIYWIASRDVAKDLIETGMNPVRLDLLGDPELQKLYPWYAVQLEAWSYATSRPRVPFYPEVSDAVSTWASKIVVGAVTAEEGLKAMQKELMEIVEQYGY